MNSSTGHYLSEIQQQVLAGDAPAIELSAATHGIWHVIVKIMRPGDSSDPFVAVYGDAFGSQSQWLVGIDQTSGELIDYDDYQSVLSAREIRKVVRFVTMNWHHLVDLYRNPALNPDTIQWQKRKPGCRDDWLAPLLTSTDMQTHESFRNKRRFLCDRKFPRRRYGRIKGNLKFHSVLRWHNKHWRTMSILGRKTFEQVGILKIRGGKRVERPLLISTVRTRRWYCIASAGRTLNPALQLGECGINYITHEGALEFFEYGNLRLSVAPDDACLVLDKDYWCCSHCSARIISRSEITHEDDYLFIIPLFQATPDDAPSNNL